MSWGNNLLATHLLQPSPSSQSWTNRSRETGAVEQQDGKLALLVILTTSTALAIILLLLILVRIGCLKGKLCLRRRHKERRSSLSRFAVSDRELAQQASIQTTFEHSRQKHDTSSSSSYTMKLIDNDLIIETQVTTPIDPVQLDDGPITFGWEQQEPELVASTSLAFQPMETQSLEASPKTPTRQLVSWMTPSGFGLTQSRTSCVSDDENERRHSYRYGNQLEYCGGAYGYVDPLFSHHFDINMKQDR